MHPSKYGELEEVRAARSQGVEAQPACNFHGAGKVEHILENCANTTESLPCQLLLPLAS